MKLLDSGGEAGNVLVDPGERDAELVNGMGDRGDGPDLCSGDRDRCGFRVVSLLRGCQVNGVECLGAAGDHCVQRPSAAA